jgi:hypothetical protein
MMNTAIIEKRDFFRNEPGLFCRVMAGKNTKGKTGKILGKTVSQIIINYALNDF